MNVDQIFEFFTWVNVNRERDVRVMDSKNVEACSPSFHESFKNRTRKNIRPEYGFQEARENYTGRTEWWREVSETSQS
jgi:hypothetical protein